MDTSDPAITFDAEGVCSHCRAYEERSRLQLLPAPEREAALLRLVEALRAAGRGRKYDCLIGLSGGVDSTYVAWLLVKRFGLRPLAVHFDNGWNSELAVSNVERTVRTLGIDLKTFVMDWNEFRDLQLSFLKARLSSLEVPTDHGIVALLFRTAAQEGLHHIISGSNIVTEAIMPRAWQHDYRDLRFLRAVHRRHGTVPLKRFPQMSLFHWLYYVYVRRIRYIPILNLTDFNKQAAMDVLVKELDWRPYRYKHGESIFTRFFQNYWLPTKFGYDKRKPHLSTLVNSGQITRDEALAEMNKPLYYGREADEELDYVAKKFRISRAELDDLVVGGSGHASDFPNNEWVFKRAVPFMAFVKRRATSV